MEICSSGKQLMLNNAVSVPLQSLLPPARIQLLSLLHALVETTLSKSLETFLFFSLSHTELSLKVSHLFLHKTCNLQNSTKLLH